MPADVAGEEQTFGIGVEQRAVGAARDVEVAIETAVTEGDVELMLTRVVACGGEAGRVER